MCVLVSLSFSLSLSLSLSVCVCVMFLTSHVALIVGLFRLFIRVIPLGSVAIFPEVFGSVLMPNPGKTFTFKYVITGH